MNRTSDTFYKISEHLARLFNPRGLKIPTEMQLASLALRDWRAHAKRFFSSLRCWITIGVAAGQCSFQTHPGLDD